MNTGLTVHDFLSLILVRVHNRIPEALLRSEASNESLTLGIDSPFISLVAGEFADISFLPIMSSRHYFVSIGLCIRIRACFFHNLKAGIFHISLTNTPFGKVQQQIHRFMLGL